MARPPGSEPGHALDQGWSSLHLEKPGFTVEKMPVSLWKMEVEAWKMGVQHDLTMENGRLNIDRRWDFNKNHKGFTKQKSRSYLMADHGMM